MIEMTYNIFFLFFLVPKRPLFLDTVAKYGTDDKKTLINLDIKFAEVVSTCLVCSLLVYLYETCTGLESKMY